MLKALKSEKDRFNRYQAVSIDFFNNFLFGKDEDGFKQVVIRGLIREYKKYVLPDADDASKSPLGQLAREVKECAQALGGRVAPPVAMRAPEVKAPVHTAAVRVPATPVEQEKKVDSFTVGEFLTGEVNRVDENCAYVSVRNYFGIVPKGQVSNDWVDDVRNFVEQGQSVSVKVIKIDRDNDRLILSMKQCC